MKLGYLLSRYPLISETFILREMVELRRLGFEIVVAPLLPARTRVRHAAAGIMDPFVAWHPWFSGTLLNAHVKTAARLPAPYLQSFMEAAGGSWGDRNLLAGALAYWPKAVAMAESFSRARVDHIHAHYGTHPALAALIIHRLTGIPFSFTVHAHDLYVHPRMLDRKTAEAAFVVTISDFNRRRLRELCPADLHERIHVIRCGIRPGDFAHSEPGRRHGPLRLLTVASLQPYKGHRYLIDACAQLRGAVEFECRLIGGGELETDLRRRIRTLGLEDQIHLLGPQPEERVRMELAEADVFVLPSIQEPSGKMEGIPVALMEAMAAGLPVVASRLSGIPELVEDGRSGLLTPPADAAALAAAIRCLEAPQLRSRMGECGRMAVRREYDLERNVARLADLFRSGPHADPAGNGPITSGRVAA